MIYKQCTPTLACIKRIKVARITAIIHMYMMIVIGRPWVSSHHMLGCYYLCTINHVTQIKFILLPFWLKLV